MHKVGVLSSFHAKLCSNKPGCVGARHSKMKACGDTKGQNMSTKWPSNNDFASFPVQPSPKQQQKLFFSLSSCPPSFAPLVLFVSCPSLQAQTSSLTFQMGTTSCFVIMLLQCMHEATCAMTDWWFASAHVCLQQLAFVSGVGESCTVSEEKKRKTKMSLCTHNTKLLSIPHHELCTLQRIPYRIVVNIVCSVHDTKKCAYESVFQFGCTSGVVFALYLSEVLCNTSPNKTGNEKTT